MNIILVALNARYGHTNLAVRLLKEYCCDLPANITVMEFTVNNDMDYVLRSIYESRPDIIGFSCYIWNIEKVCLLARALRKLLPNIFILAGGPEVSYEYDGYLSNDTFDAIAIGEGEEIFKQIVLTLLYSCADTFSDCEGTTSLHYGVRISKIPGVALKPRVMECLSSSRNTVGRNLYPISLDLIPLGYTKSELEGLHDRIIYYEASRGCPFSCAYCLSGSSVGVRFRAVKGVFENLDVFLKAGVRLVKFVDRTFNCNGEFARMIWEFLISKDNGKTRFHFEIAADLLGCEDFEVLKKVRPGYFQFEAGIQTSNLQTLEQVNRKCDIVKLEKNISELIRLSNINIHLDLIAGLPGDDLKSFSGSVEFAYSLLPHQLQLGFLKLIKGSGLRNDAARLGLSYRDEAPYEVLSTPSLSYDDLCVLKLISETINIYHNSEMFGHSLRYLTRNGAWSFFRELSELLKSIGIGRRAFGKPELFAILAEYCVEDSLALNLLKFDMLLNESTGNDPDWFPDSMDSNEKRRAREYFKKKKEASLEASESQTCITTAVSRKSHIYKFSFDIPEFILNGYKNASKHLNYVLFEYAYGRDMGPGTYSRVNI